LEGGNEGLGSPIFVPRCPLSFFAFAAVPVVEEAVGAVVGAVVVVVVVEIDMEDPAPRNDAAEVVDGGIFGRPFLTLVLFTAGPFFFIITEDWWRYGLFVLVFLFRTAGLEDSHESTSRSVLSEGFSSSVVVASIVVFSLVGLVDP